MDSLRGGWASGQGRTRIVSLLLLLGVVACGPSPKPPNLVLVIADTMRADKMGCYGNNGGFTPFLDALAQDALLFENASSHAPWTLPSTASLLTSLHPRQHGAGGKAPNFTGLDPEVSSLAQLLKQRGYATHAVVNVLFLGETFGLARGFDTVDEEHYKSNVEVRSAESTTDAAIAWLEQTHEEPFFLLVHYFDPHAVYAPPQPFRRKFAAPPDRTDESFQFGTRSFMSKLRFGGARLDPELVHRAERLYEGEIAYTDGQIGRLFDALRTRAVYEDSVVVFTADHGEEFLEHGGFEHGHSLYPELTHIPLLISYPKGLEPGRVAQSVGHIDVAPTLCELLDIAAPTQFVGQSLLALTQAPSLPGRSVLAHGNMWGAPLTSLRNAEHLLILPSDSADGALRPELYDWRADPACKEDLAASQPELLRSLSQELLEREQKLERIGAGSDVQLSPEQLEGLEGLGYGEGKSPADSE